LFGYCVAKPIVSADVSGQWIDGDIFKEEKTMLLQPSARTAVSVSDPRHDYQMMRNRTLPVVLKVTSVANFHSISSQDCSEEYG